MVTEIPHGIPKYQVGNYRLGRLLGSGGMARVFAAIQETKGGIHRLVALKLISPQISQFPETERWFVREATILSRLEHPNVVRVYDSGKIDGSCYLAMELVHGVTISSLLQKRDKPLPLQLAIYVTLEVAQALKAVHELTDIHGNNARVIHQDVSPQNIMISYRGAVRLLDFGIARVGSIDGSRTDTLRGKLYYLAPEQWNGESLNDQTDLYALGVTLFQMLSDTHSESLNARFQFDPSLIADIPSEVVQLIAALTCEQKSERIRNADELIEYLTEIYRNLGIQRMFSEQAATIVAADAPPTWMPSELEREIVGNRNFLDEHISVTDMSTVHGALPSPVMEIENATTLLDSTPQFPIQKKNAPYSLRSILMLSMISFGIVFSFFSFHRPAGILIARSGFSNTYSASAMTSIISVPSVASSVALESSQKKTSQRMELQRTSSSAPVPATESSKRSIQLSVWSDPWGNVAIDGIQAGDSPIQLNVPPGNHSVTVTTSDGRTQTKTIHATDSVLVRFVF